MLFNNLSKAAIAGGLIVLVGCASLSTEECKRGDWFAIGKADGAVGASMSRIDDHTKACRKAGVAPDLQAYTTGRKAGLTEFCTYQSGVAQGAENRTYKRVCTGPAEAEFLGGYDFGQQIYGLNQRIAQIEGNINDTRELLYAKDLKDDNRYRLENILEGLETQRADLRVEVRMLLEQGRIARVQ